MQVAATLLQVADIVQNDLALAPETRRSWYCAIHGTVSACPFLWMSCDYADGSAETAKPHTSDWAEVFGNRLPSIRSTQDE